MFRSTVYNLGKQKRHQSDACCDTPTGWFEVWISSMLDSVVLYKGSGSRALAKGSDKAAKILLLLGEFRANL